MTKKKIKTKDLWSANMGLPIVWVVTVLTGYAKSEDMIIRQSWDSFAQAFEPVVSNIMI